MCCSACRHASCADTAWFAFPTRTMLGRLDAPSSTRSTHAHLLYVRRRELLDLAHIGDGAPPGAGQRVRRAQRARQARVGCECVQQLDAVPLMHIRKASGYNRLDCE